MATATEERIHRWLDNLLDERDGIALYEGLASAERDASRAAAFRSLAEGERRHARIWEKKLEEAGRLPAPGRPSARVRALVALARVFGTTSVLPIVIQTESADMDKYARQPGIARSLVSEEREHREVLEKMAGREPPTGAEIIAQREPWHGRGMGSVRAAVFGVNDGIVSNTALVLGVAAAGTGDSGVVLAGVAGLVAGACSMAAGEYISVASQRDLLTRQVELERREILDAPEEEEAELAMILVRKGLPEAQAKEVAAQIFKDPEKALDTLVREELGLDPADLGSPVGAAVPSFFAFGIGALLPLAPYLLLVGLPAAIASAVVAATVLGLVGGSIGFLSGTGGLRSAFRMVGLASIAAAVTVGLGKLVGASLAG